MFKKFSIFLLFIIVEASVGIMPQSFQTYRLKDSEIFHFFELPGKNVSKKPPIKIENSFEFYMDYAIKNEKSVKLPDEIVNTFKNSASKNYTKNKILYFVLEHNTVSKYAETANEYSGGNPEEYNALSSLYKKDVTYPVFINREFFSEEINAKEKQVDKSKKKKEINEFVLFVDLLNDSREYKNLLLNGVFRIHAGTNSSKTEINNANDYQVVLGVKIDELKDIILKKEIIQEGEGGSSKISLYQLGLPVFLKRVMLYDKVQEAIIYDSFIE